LTDTHQHFWKFDPVRDAWITPEMDVLRRNFLPDDLQPVLNTCGITGTIAVQADQSTTETNFLLHLAAEYPFIKGVVGWIDLQSKDLESELECFSGNPVLKGFRHIVQAETDPGFLLRPDFLKGLKLISDLGYTYDVLIKPHQLPMAIAFAQNLPQAKLVIDHLAKPPIRSGEWKDWAGLIRAFRDLNHVYCKVSGMVTEADSGNLNPENFRIYLDVITEVFGTERLMYGSDWPVCLLATDYASQLRIVTDYFSGFSESDRSSVFINNANRFYGL
jgi:L-fuconolactonase